MGTKTNKGISICGQLIVQRSIGMQNNAGFHEVLRQDSILY